MDRWAGAVALGGTSGAAEPTSVGKELIALNGLGSPPLPTNLFQPQAVQPGGGQNRAFPMDAQDDPSGTPRQATTGQPISPEAGLGLKPLTATASRWSGSLWLFVREGGDGAALATAGQLGGSQAGIRLRWRINEGRAIRTALTTRLSVPLNDSRGTEASMGAEWHPLMGRPLWIAIERRVALGDHARNAWSAYAAGGIWRSGLPFGLTLDGYAQGGIVGARSRDLFADGAIKLGHTLSEKSGLRVSAATWAAAQPGVSRLDIGPELGVPLSLDGHSFTLSIDARIRVAGGAVPATGIALTLGQDF